MKKVLAGIAVFALVFALATTPIFAAGHGRGHGGGGGGTGTGSGTGTGAGICANCDNCFYDGECPYGGDCPSSCPNNGTGAHHRGGRGSNRTLGKGIHAADGSCRA